MKSSVEGFPFSSPFTTAYDIGDLTAPTSYGAGAHDGSTDGFKIAGRIQPFAEISGIESFPLSNPFASSSNIGDLSVTALDIGATESSTDAYSTINGGIGPAPIGNTIESFPFSSPFTTATDVGDLSESRKQARGLADGNTDGYFAGGNIGTPAPFTNSDRVDSFPFSSPFATATDVGDLFNGQVLAVTVSSPTDGWVAFGPPAASRIMSFPFSSPWTTTTIAAFVGSNVNFTTAGASDGTDGYVSGGAWSSPAEPASDNIHSWPFSSPFTDTTSIGSLNEQRRDTTGTND